MGNPTAKNSGVTCWSNGFSRVWGAVADSDPAKAVTPTKLPQGV